MTQRLLVLAQESLGEILSTFMEFVSDNDIRSRLNTAPGHDDDSLVYRYPGGWLDHTLDVLERMFSQISDYGLAPQDVFLAGFFHDFYKFEMRLTVRHRTMIEPDALGSHYRRRAYLLQCAFQNQRVCRGDLSLALLAAANTDLLNALSTEVVDAIRMHDSSDVTSLSPLARLLREANEASILQAEPTRSGVFLGT